jgi:catechol 2,3-dioxygenase-like lactoylglutathione lyase family enzyme
MPSQQTLVLTVADIDATVSFYGQLGMRTETFSDGRIALRFGEQKINLHQCGAEITPNAGTATPVPPTCASWSRTRSNRFSRNSPPRE